MDLFEGVFVEEREELENWEVWVELNSLQVRVDKPVKEITAFTQEPGHNVRERERERDKDTDESPLKGGGG